MAKEILTMNDVWLKIAQFLGTLNGENVKRESYVRTPEYEAALEAWKETEHSLVFFCLSRKKSVCRDESIEFNLRISYNEKR